MEQNLPLATKKIWTLIHVMLFMLKKNMSRTKLLLDLNMMIKRAKIAGKALRQFLMVHLQRSVSAFNRNAHRSSDFTFPTPLTEDYDQLSYKSKHKRKKSTVNDYHDEIFVDPAVIKALEMLTVATESPGFGKSPMVRQLRITDSPFPLSNEEDGYVDEAAEMFIMKFYNDLRRQS